MNKIDLIIDYLDNIGEVTFAHQGWAGVERLNKALAAARELKALKPKAFCALTPNGMIGYFDGKPMIMVGKVGNDCHTTPLYALDEVTK
jgi:hypothetical protein